MVELKFIIHSDKFKEDVKKIKDKGLKIKLEKQIDKIFGNPNFGKPLRYNLKGERTIYVKPYRLLYRIEGDKLILLRFEHRNHAYER